MFTAEMPCERALEGNRRLLSKYSEYLTSVGDHHSVPCTVLLQMTSLQLGKNKCYDYKLLPCLYQFGEYVIYCKIQGNLWGEKEKRW